MFCICGSSIFVLLCLFGLVVVCLSFWGFFVCCFGLVCGCCLLGVLCGFLVGWLGGVFFCFVANRYRNPGG